MAYLQERFHLAKVTGRVLCAHMGQGAVMAVTTEQVAKIPIGGELEKSTDQAFKNNA
ncbi:MAG: hypothetical protein ACP5EP_11445 [Acidobacteriaceae bacterium]